MSSLDTVSVISKAWGTISLPVVLEETWEDELQITEHPVEMGPEISDHAFKRTPLVTMQCGWSNADYAGLLGTSVKTFASGSLPGSQYIMEVYSQLLALQETRKPFDVVTSLRSYTSMLFKSLVVKKDQKTGNALMVTATLKHIRIVETKSTTLPAREDQAQPASTAETENTGTKAPVAATPAPGGSVTPDQWSQH